MVDQMNHKGDLDRDRTFDQNMHAIDTNTSYCMHNKSNEYACTRENTPGIGVQHACVRRFDVQ